MKFLNDIINEVDTTTNLLLFPMDTARDKKDKQGFHWTLLVLDLRTRTWLHYNTMPPRGKKKNIFLEDAKQMKQAVTDILNMQLLYRGMTVLEDHTKIISKECPRQGFSVDCALYVCEFIERLVQVQEIPKEFEDKDLMSKKRAHIVWLILTDIPYCWRLEDHIERMKTLEFVKNNKDLFIDDDDQQ
ncbi:hypothetical protein LguiA_013683 [Lonicera macranthoides]